MRMKKGLLRSCAAMMVIVAGLAAAGCGGGQKTAAPAADSGAAKEIIAYGELDPQVSGQQIIAEEMGYFKEEGLNIKNKLMTGPDENAALVASGEAGICFGSIYNNIAVSANGVKVKVLAPLANAAGTQSVVGRKNLQLTSAKDLEGKKIGMTNGAGVLIAIRNMAAATGTDINKIQFVNLPVSDQLAALEKSITASLATKAASAPMLARQREAARATVAEFVQKWLMTQTDWKPHAGKKVEVLFADEPIDALDATCGGRPGCAAERLNAAGL